MHILIEFVDDACLLQGLEDDPTKWSSARVGEWMSSLGSAFAKLAPEFIETGVDGELLFELDDEALATLMPKKFHRNVFQMKLRKLKVIPA